MRGVKAGTKRGTYSKHIYVKDIVGIFDYSTEARIINSAGSIIYDLDIGTLGCEEFKEFDNKEVINIEVWENTLMIFVI